MLQAGRRTCRQTEGQWERQLHGLETTRPRSGAVSFLLRPRVTALGTNELRRRARRGLYDPAPFSRPPPFPGVLCPCVAPFSLS
jgi:hypothetical protein